MFLKHKVPNISYVAGSRERSKPKQDRAVLQQSGLASKAEVYLKLLGGTRGQLQMLSHQLHMDFQPDEKFLSPD